MPALNGSIHHLEIDEGFQRILSEALKRAKSKISDEELGLASSSHTLTPPTSSSQTSSSHSSRSTRLNNTEFIHLVATDAVFNDQEPSFEDENDKVELSSSDGARVLSPESSIVKSTVADIRVMEKDTIYLSQENPPGEIEIEAVEGVNKLRRTSIDDAGQDAVASNQIGNEKTTDVASHDTFMQATLYSRLHHYFEKSCDRLPKKTALQCGDESLTYARLDKRANHLARFLRDEYNIQPGSRVCILLYRSVETYVSLLAVLKCGAAFVPMDPAFPSERMEFMVLDSEAALLLTTSSLEAMVANVQCPVLHLDLAVAAIEEKSGRRLKVGGYDDSICYIIYTSGTTGRPKGVCISHANICNFISVVLPLYGVTQGDRVYQGITIAFDFSIEEIWPTFAIGATLIAGPTDHRKLGSDLAQFLYETRTTVMYCVPTLLSTIDRALPWLQIINVGGEACSDELVKRWSPGRVMLNTYGPTETTVTASLAQLEPGKKVTIGKPLPTYTMHILDENQQPVADGELGEIWIGGKGVATEYLHRPEKTAAAFYTDFLDKNSIHDQGRLFRTGDLGLLTEDGEIEIKGRIDDQVKVRGYRIELSEIEAVIQDNDAITSAVVKLADVGSSKELVAYVTLHKELISTNEAQPSYEALKMQLNEEMRSKLPPYMIPAFVEVIDAMPTLPSGKTDRKKLQPPCSKRLSSICSDTPFIPPDTPLEHEVSDVWCSVFKINEVSVADNFFTDLGGHSMAAAQVVSKFRQGGCSVLQRLSISDVYAYPTIRAMCQHLRPVHMETGAKLENQEEVVTSKAVKDERIIHSSTRVWICGIAQFMIAYVSAFSLTIPFAMLLRRGVHPAIAAMILGAMASPILLVLPFIAKWLLIGKYRAGRYPLWGFYYLRFWLVARLMAVSPLPALAGTPFLALYMQLLGARIGHGCHIASGRIHLPDLVEIEDGVSIGYGAAIECYVVREGWLYLAPVKIEKDAYIGTGAVLMPGSTVEKGAMVLEQTLVKEGQTIPSGETWAGSPSQLVPPDPILSEMASHPTQAPRQWSPSLMWSFVLVILVFFGTILPLLMIGPSFAFLWFGVAHGGFDRGADLKLMAIYSPLAGLIFIASALFALALSKHVIMHRTPRGIYPLRSMYGVRKWAADFVMGISLAVTNSLYATLYSSPWLRALGAKIGKRAEVSTISSIDPDLMIFGDESFFADMAIVGPARHHRGRIFTDVTEIGPRTFFGNAALANPGTTLKDNILIGVLSVPPTDQELMVSGSNWLGSPAIYLPRRQESQKFDEGVTYNPPIRLYAIRLTIEFFRVTLPACLMGTTAMTGVLLGWWVARIEWLSLMAVSAILPSVYLGIMFVVYLIIVAMKWIIVGRYHKHVAPLWSHFVWRSEFITAMFESAAVPGLIGGFQGTPFIAPLLRMLGAKIGSRVYLETTYVTEFDLVDVGNDVAVGGTCSLQTHLFEDRVMKMDVVKVGDGVSIGPRSIVLYGCHVEKGVYLDGLSLVMKGERIPANTKWCGVPCSFMGEYEARPEDAPPRPKRNKKSFSRSPSSVAPEKEGRSVSFMLSAAEEGALPN